MADRIVVMRAGRLEQAGPPLDLYDRPANAFVAGFIGSPAMNFLPGVAEAGKVRLAGGTTLPLETRHRGAVQYGIRPEHLDLVAPDATGAFTGQVGLIESTGSAMFVAVKTAETVLHALFTDRPILHRDDRVGLHPKAGLCHLFNADTGERLT